MWSAGGTTDPGVFVEDDVKEVTCICGWSCRGTEDEVVAQVMAHGREAHAVESTRDEILAIAVEVPAGQAPPPSD